MQFLIRKGLLIYSSLFALLLVAHSVIFFSEDAAPPKEIRLATPITTESAALATEENDDVKLLTALQLLLVASGLPLLFLLIRQSDRTAKSLAGLTQTLSTNNNELVFNWGNDGGAQSEEEAQTRLISNLKKVRDFITAISGGDYSITWDGLNKENHESNRATIAGALLHMRDEMQRVKEEDKLRIWTTEGLSKFGEIIRRHQDDIDKLCESLISNVVTYVGAKVGGLFILEEDEETSKDHLMLRACYAYERKKHIAKRVEIGEGIVGQCYLEAQTVYMAKVPNNYLSITSGLGGANPSSLLVIPLRTNDKVEGVLEIASLKPFESHEISFLEKLGELLASSIITVKSSEKTKRLLQISQEQAEEMRAQEEEMRQNMEELEATQEQMNRDNERNGGS